MKKRFKAAWLLMAWCFLATTLLTACGEKAKDNGTSAGTTAAISSGADAAAAPEVVTLKVKYAGNGPQQDTQKVIDEFNKELAEWLPNTKADIEFIQSTQYEEKLRLMLVAGDVVDVADLLSGSGEAKNDLVTEAKKGTMIALDDLLAKAPKLTSAISQGLWARSKVEGKIYMVPINQAITDKFIGIKTQTELADKYLDVQKLKDTLVNDNGIVKKETYDILSDYLKKLKDAGQIRRGVSVETMQWLPQRGYYSLYNWAFVALKSDTQGCKVLNYFEQPEVKMMYDIHRDWYVKGYIEKDILSMQNRRQYEKKLDGNVLAMTTQFIDDPNYPEQNPDKVDTENYGYPVTTVTWEKNYFITPAGNSSQGLIIPRTSKNPERAMQYIEMTNTNIDAYQMLTFGLEGEHYNRNSNGDIESVIKDATQAKYLQGGWNIGNQLMSDPRSVNSAKYMDYVNNIQMGTAIVTPVAGFRLDVEPVKNELTQFDNVRKEYETSLYSGAVESYEDLYKEMLQKMKEAGSEKIIIEIQRQVDEYLKANPVK